MSRPLLVGQTEFLKSSKNLIRLKGGHFRANWKLSNSGIKGSMYLLSIDTKLHGH